MVEDRFDAHWDRLFFRDYLRAHPETAAQYEVLKRELAAKCPHDRVAYSRRKMEFIERVTGIARQELGA